MTGFTRHQIQYGDEDEMLDRRRFLCGCGALALSGGVVDATNNQQSRHQYQCGISTADFNYLVAGDRLYTFEDLKKQYDIKLESSHQNDPLFESAFSAARRDLGAEFKVSPAFRYYDSSILKRNAVATCVTLPDQKNSDGTVMFSKKLYLDALKHKAGDIGILAVCAHEFGHIAAFKRKLLPCFTIEIAYEMHADYLAGYYLGKLQNNLNYSLDLSGVTELWESFNPNNPSHGTRNMRRESLNRGYYLARNNPRMDFDNAFASATAYINKYQ